MKFLQIFLHFEYLNIFLINLVTRAYSFFPLFINTSHREIRKLCRFGITGENHSFLFNIRTLTFAKPRLKFDNLKKNYEIWRTLHGGGGGKNFFALVNFLLFEKSILKQSERSWSHLQMNLLGARIFWNES